MVRVLAFEERHPGNALPSPFESLLLTKTATSMTQIPCGLFSRQPSFGVFQTKHAPTCSVVICCSWVVAISCVLQVTSTAGLGKGNHSCDSILVSLDEAKNNKHCILAIMFMSALSARLTNYKVEESVCKEKFLM
jgi:hypothetical protein